MSFGNRLGVKIEANVDKRDLFTAGFGDIVAEVPADKVAELGVTYTVVGEVTESGFAYGDMKIATEEALKTWEEPLEKVFPTTAVAGAEKVESPLYKADSVYEMCIRDRACVALNPTTPLNVLDYVLEDLDMVLLMTINPGFGGQKYIESSTRKIQELRKRMEARGLEIDIEVDGGIKLNNVKTVLDAGANIIVAGSAVYGGDVQKNVADFMKILGEA